MLKKNSKFNSLSIATTNKQARSRYAKVRFCSRQPARHMWGSGEFALCYNPGVLSDTVWPANLPVSHPPAQSVLYGHSHWTLSF